MYPKSMVWTKILKALNEIFIILHLKKKSLYVLLGQVFVMVCYSTVCLLFFFFFFFFFLLKILKHTTVFFVTDFHIVNSFKPGVPFMGHRQTERGVPSGAILFA